MIILGMIVLRLFMASKLFIIIVIIVIIINSKKENSKYVNVGDEFNSSS